MNKSKNAAEKLGTLHGPVNRPMKGLFKSKKKEYNELKCPDTEPERPIKQLKNFKQHIGGTRSQSKPKDKVESKLSMKQGQSGTNINSKNSSRVHYTSSKLYYKPSSKSPAVSNLRSTSIQKEVKSNLSSHLQAKADQMMKRKVNTKKHVHFRVIKDDVNKQHSRNVELNGNAISKPDVRSDMERESKIESERFADTQENIISQDGAHKLEEPSKSLSESIKKASITESKKEEPKEFKQLSQEDVKATENSNPETKVKEQKKEEKPEEVQIEKSNKPEIVNQPEQPQEEHKSQSVPNCMIAQKSSESCDPSRNENLSELKPREVHNMDKYEGKTEEEVAEMFIEENTVKEGEHKPINEVKKDDEEEPQNQQSQEPQSQHPTNKSDYPDLNSKMPCINNHLKDINEKMVEDALNYLSSGNMMLVSNKFKYEQLAAINQWKIEQEKKENERRRKELEEKSKNQANKPNGNRPS